MSRRMRIILMFVLALGVVTEWAEAEGVTLEVPLVVLPRATFQIKLTAEYRQDFGRPTFPVVPGIVVGEPSNRTLRELTGGRGGFSARKTVTWTWPARVDREGTYRIPAFAINIDGVDEMTEPRSIEVRSPGEGVPVRARLVASRSIFYVGEAVEVRLEIFIRPYQNEEHPVDWTPQNSWGQVALDKSRWGEFRSSIGVLSGPFSRSLPPHERVKLPDENGVPVEYHQFTLTTRIVPRSAGGLNASGISIVVEYPTGLRRTRRGLEISGRQRIEVTPEAEAIRVLEPPKEDQPAFYAGAVGRYDILTRIEETKVLVGDPVNLELILIDRGIDDPRLESLRPPDFFQMPALLQDFEISTSALAGTLYPRERAKVFHPTLRPRRAEVTEIPPIPFAYFDPVQQRYFTVYSDAVPLTVLPTESLSMADIEGGTGGAGASAEVLTEVHGGLQANDIGAALLQRPVPWRFSEWHYAALLIGPLLGFGGAALRWRGNRQSDVTGSRRRRARSRARRALETARSDQVGAVLASYVADRCNRVDGALTASDVADELAAGGVDPALRNEVAELIRTAERARYGGGGAESELRESAAALISRLERETW